MRIIRITTIFKGVYGKSQIQLTDPKQNRTVK